MSSPIEEAVQLHGHLGPNVVIGAKMALYARKLLGHTDLQAHSEVRKEPPMGCMNDGIRALCSKLKIGKQEKPEATFSYGNKSVRIWLRKNVLRSLEERLKIIRDKCGRDMHAYFREIEKLGYIYWTYSPEELFEVHGALKHSPEVSRL